MKIKRKNQFLMLILFSLIVVLADFTAEINRTYQVITLYNKIR